MQQSRAESCDIDAVIDVHASSAPVRMTSRVTLSRGIHGHAGVSPNLAVRLERSGVGTARMWLSMQTRYDLPRELDGKEHEVCPLVVE